MLLPLWRRDVLTGPFFPGQNIPSQRGKKHEKEGRPGKLLHVCRVFGTKNMDIVTEGGRSHRKKSTCHGVFGRQHCFWLWILSTSPTGHLHLHTRGSTIPPIWQPTSDHSHPALGKVNLVRYDVVRFVWCGSGLVASPSLAWPFVLLCNMKKFRPITLASQVSHSSPPMTRVLRRRGEMVY